VKRSTSARRHGAVIWGLAFVASRLRSTNFRGADDTLRFAIAALPCCSCAAESLVAVLISISFTLFLGQFLGRHCIAQRTVGLSSVIVQSQALFTIASRRVFGELPTRASRRHRHRHRRL